MHRNVTLILVLLWMTNVLTVSSNNPLRKDLRRRRGSRNSFRRESFGEERRQRPLPVFESNYDQETIYGEGSQSFRSQYKFQEHDQNGNRQPNERHRDGRHRRPQGRRPNQFSHHEPQLQNNENFRRDQAEDSNGRRPTDQLPHDDNQQIRQHKGPTFGNNRQQHFFRPTEQGQPHGDSPFGGSGQQSIRFEEEQVGAKQPSKGDREDFGGSNQFKGVDDQQNNHRYREEIRADFQTLQPDVRFEQNEFQTSGYRQRENDRFPKPPQFENQEQSRPSQGGFRGFNPLGQNGNEQNFQSVHDQPIGDQRQSQGDDSKSRHRDEPPNGQRPGYHVQQIQGVFDSRNGQNIRSFEQTQGGNVQQQQSNQAEFGQQTRGGNGQHTGSEYGLQTHRGTGPQTEGGYEQHGQEEHGQEGHEHEFQGSYEPQTQGDQELQIQGGNGPQTYGGNDQQIQGGNEPQIFGGRQQQIHGGNGPQTYGGNKQQIKGGNGPQTYGGSEQQIQGGNEPQIHGSQQPQIQGGNGPQPYRSQQQQIQGGNEPQTYGGSEQQIQGGNKPQTYGGSEQQIQGGNRPQTFGSQQKQTQDGNGLQTYGGQEKHIQGGARPQTYGSQQQQIQGGNGPQTYGSQQQQIQNGNEPQIYGSQQQQIQNGNEPQIYGSQQQKIQNGNEPQIYELQQQQIQGGNGPQTYGSQQQQIQDGNGPQTYGSQQQQIQDGNGPQTYGNQQQQIQDGNGPQTYGVQQIQGEKGPQTYGVQQQQIQGGNGPQIYGDQQKQIQDGNGPQAYGGQQQQIQDGNGPHTYGNQEQQIGEGNGEYFQQSQDGHEQQNQGGYVQQSQGQEQQSQEHDQHQQGRYGQQTEGSHNKQKQGGYGEQSHKELGQQVHDREYEQREDDSRQKQEHIHQLQDSNAPDANRPHGGIQHGYAQPPQINPSTDEREQQKYNQKSTADFNAPLRTIQNNFVSTGHHFGNQSQQNGHTEQQKDSNYHLQQNNNNQRIQNGLGFQPLIGNSPKLEAGDTDYNQPLEIKTEIGEQSNYGQKQQLNEIHAYDQRRQPGTQVDDNINTISYDGNPSKFRNGRSQIDGAKIKNVKYEKSRDEQKVLFPRPMYSYDWVPVVRSQTSGIRKSRLNEANHYETIPTKSIIQLSTDFAVEKNFPKVFDNYDAKVEMQHEYQPQTDHEANVPQENEEHESPTLVASIDAQTFNKFEQEDLNPTHQEFTIPELTIHIPVDAFNPQSFAQVDDSYNEPVGIQAAAVQPKYEDGQYAIQGAENEEKLPVYEDKQQGIEVYDDEQPEVYPGSLDAFQETQANDESSTTTPTSVTELEHAVGYGTDDVSVLPDYKAKTTKTSLKGFYVTKVPKVGPVESDGATYESEVQTNAEKNDVEVVYTSYKVDDDDFDLTRKEMPKTVQQTLMVNPDEKYFILYKPISIESTK